MTANIHDRDIFDPRHFGDYLRYTRPQIAGIALEHGYKFVAWHDGCVYNAVDGERVFCPENLSHKADFTGWRNDVHYLGLNAWLRGDQRRGFVAVPLAA